MLSNYLGAEWDMPDYRQIMHPELEYEKETKESVIKHILGELEDVTEVRDGRIYAGSETDAE